MSTDPQPDTGMDMRDLLSDPHFRTRTVAARPANGESRALRRLSRLFAEEPETVLQELVDTAVEYCGADSAGISLEEPENGTFRWVVVSGSFSPYLNGRTPRHYSPCGSCLDAARPQLYRVTQPYYDQLGVTARPIHDGVLIPWSNEFFRGTLWAVSHAAGDTFGFSDYELLDSLSDFAAIILRHRHQQKLLLQMERARGVADMAHIVAHRINNPLQSLTNTIYLALQGDDVQRQLFDSEMQLKRLSEEVSKLLIATNLVNEDR